MRELLGKAWFRDGPVTSHIVLILQCLLGFVPDGKMVFVSLGLFA